MGYDISDADLRLIAQIEGRPKLLIREAAAAFGVSESQAWRTVERLRSAGIIRHVMGLRRDLVGGEIECVAYVDVMTSELADIRSFEAMLANDPAVWSAVRVTGIHDYRIQAFHKDMPSARVWYANLRLFPSVSNGELIITRSLFERPCFAAAILGEGEPARERSHSKRYVAPARARR